MVSRLKALAHDSNRMIAGGSPDTFIKAVRPPLSAISLSAPESSSKRTTSRSHLEDAIIKAVQPSSSAKSGLAPASRSKP